MATASIAEVDLEEGTLMPIGIETLCSAGMLPFDLYLNAQGPSRPVLYRQKDHPVDDDDLKKLLQRGVHTLYIPQGESASYREYLRETLLANDEIPPVQRYQVLREATRSVLTEALTKGDPTRPSSSRPISATASCRPFAIRTTVLNDLLRVMSHDYSVFTHAVNVATHCLLLARRFGITDQARRCCEIGQGALLHDIGMQSVPRHIIDKPDKLTDRERRIVQEHPARGFQELCRRPDVTWGQLMMVYSHHERCDGRGYPVGLGAIGDPRVRSASARLPTFTRPCAATGPIGGRRGRQDVLEYLDRQAGRAFDEEMTRCWIAAVGKLK